MQVSDNVGGTDIGGEASEPVQWLGRANPLSWTFLKEPAWKWAAFLVALSLFAAAWKGVLRYMK